MNREPLLRVWDVARTDPDLIIEIEAAIEELLAHGELVKRDIGGDRHVGLLQEILRRKAEPMALARSPRAKVEVALYDAALEAHPAWAEGKAFSRPTYVTCKDPCAGTPVTPAALIEWFELNHPTAAKRIAASCEARH